MKKRACLVLLVSLFLSWVCVIKSRTFASYDVAHQDQQDQSQHSKDVEDAKYATFDSKKGYEGIDREGLLPGHGEIVGKFRGLSRLGSRPPNCGHKCQGCAPCVPVQTPTITDHLGLQYANYEPEGWKCKCGAIIFNP